MSVIAGVIAYIVERKLAKQRFVYNEEVTPTSRRASYFKSMIFQRGTMSDMKQYSSLGQLLMSKYSDALAKKHSLTRGLDSKRLTSQLLQNIFRTVTVTLIPYTYLGYSAYSGIITLADMTALASASSTLTVSFNNISMFLSHLKENSMFISYLKTVLEYEPKIEGQSHGIIADSIESIEFKNVFF